MSEIESKISHKNLKNTFPVNEKISLTKFLSAYNLFIVWNPFKLWRLKTNHATVDTPPPIFQGTWLAV